MADNDQEEETETESSRTMDGIDAWSSPFNELKPRKAKFKALCAKQSKIIKEELKNRCKKITGILSKNEKDRSVEEIMILNESPDIVKELQKKTEKRKLAKQRVLETEDEPMVLRNKCKILAEALRNAKKVVVYTGAGISTAASIPDYRGPNGVWTLLQNGKSLEIQDLSDAVPTSTHMSLTELYYHGFISHMVSQNCDGLHLRSGFPRQHLSELHGNMYIELCKSCKPNREYVRLFDVTEKTALHRHKTGRLCHVCCEPLKDTIVHFGEKSAIKSPYRWKEAIKIANTCDMILCLGTSLKVLKRYSNLWCMDKKAAQRPNIYIVNLQWTPKDRLATLKINGKCDVVLKEVMRDLGILTPHYESEKDPIFGEATFLKDDELETTTKNILLAPSNYTYSAQKRKKLRKSVTQTKTQNKSKKLPSVCNNRSLRKNNSRTCQKRDIKPALKHSKNDTCRMKANVSAAGTSATLNNCIGFDPMKCEHLTSIFQKNIYCDKKTDSSISQNISHLHPLMQSLLEKHETSNELHKYMERFLSCNSQDSLDRKGLSISTSCDELEPCSSKVTSDFERSSLSFTQELLSKFLQQKESCFLNVLQSLASLSGDQNKETEWSRICLAMLHGSSSTEMKQDRCEHKSCVSQTRDLKVNEQLLSVDIHSLVNLESYLPVDMTRDSHVNEKLIPVDMTKLLIDHVKSSALPLISNKYDISLENSSKNVCDNMYMNTAKEQTIQRKSLRRRRTRTQSKSCEIPSIYLDHNYIKQESAQFLPSGESTDTASETSSLVDMQMTSDCDKDICSTPSEPLSESIIKANLNSTSDNDACPNSAPVIDLKRKTAQSVPGWFGKGLNIRKRRKLSQ